MKSCCGKDFNTPEALIAYCKEHCKETSGCYSISIDKVMFKTPPRKIQIERSTS